MSLLEHYIDKQLINKIFQYISNLKEIFMSKPNVLDLSKPIIVTMESFTHLKDAKLVSDDGSIFEATLIDCDEISRNRTYYPLEDVIASMDDRRVKERIEQKVFFGEAEHPSSDSEEGIPLKRLMRVEPSRISHRIDNYWAAGNIIKGIIQWAGPFGDTYRKMLVEHGSNLAMSIRAYTPNYIKKNDKDGDYVIKKHLMFITTFDCVMLPGLKNARIMNPDQYTDITKNNKTNITTNKTNGSINIKTSESMVEIAYSNPINEIKNLLRSEEGASIVSDLFNIDFSKSDMNISGNTLLVQTENGQKLHLPLSRSLIGSIL